MSKKEDAEFNEFKGEEEYRMKMRQEAEDRSHIQVLNFTNNKNQLLKIVHVQVI